MRVIKILTKKELTTAFTSWTFYVGVLLFFSICGFYCWMSDANIFILDQASMLPFFNVFKWFFLFLVPAFTMRAFAEEKRYGTLELLLTKPIRTNQLIAGKFLTLLFILLVILLLTLPYYITMLSLGNIDNGQVFTGYLGLLLIGASYSSISLFSSAISRNAISAFIGGFGIIIIFQFLFGMIANISHSLFISELFLYLSIDSHFDALARGVLDSRDIVYFCSIIVIFLFSTRVAVCKLRL